MDRIEDTIYVELVVQAIQGFSDNIYMDGSIEIRINGTKPYAESDIVDFSVFLESLKKDGEHFIFSCCCGVPDCSGWKKGIDVRHDNNLLRWTNPNLNVNWVFSKESIQSQVDEIRTQVSVYRDFFALKGIDYVGVGADW